MKKLLIVIDMQNDFITGTLGSPQAQQIVPAVLAKIEEYKQNGEKGYCRVFHGLPLYYSYSVTVTTTKQ